MASATADSNLSINHGNVKLNLIDVYCEHNVTAQLNEAFEDQKVCRFCLKLTLSCYVTDLYKANGIHIVEMLSKRIPELNISITEDLSTCESCLNILNTMQRFIVECLNVEGKINRYTGQGATDYNDESCLNLNVQRFKPLLQYTKKKVKKNTVEVNNESCLNATEKLGVKSRDSVEGQNVNINLGQEEVEESFGTSVSSEAHHKDPLEFELYKCDVCEYKTTIEKKFTQHMQFHKNRGMYKCGMCPYEGDYEKYIQHTIIHKNPSKTGIYQCEFCSHKTKFKLNLQRHVLCHRNPWELPVFKCHLCSKQYKHKKNLKYHMERNHLDFDEVKPISEISTNYTRTGVSKRSSKFVCLNMKILHKP